MTAGCIAPLCPSGREPGSLFCRKHEAAPAAKRGGWLSAEKRRRALAASKEFTLDASAIIRRPGWSLWVGGKPPLDRDLPAFDTLVLCAQEIQPDRLSFGRRVLRVPLPDAALSTDELRRALAGGRLVATELQNGNRVLVTCAMGLNRSAFVASLALGLVTRLGPAEIIDLMRQRRSERALSNPHFVAAIERFVGAARRPPTRPDR